MEIYEEASSQQINLSKTMMTFSNNVMPEMKQQIMSFWGVTEQ